MKLVLLGLCLRYRPSGFHCRWPRPRHQPQHQHQPQHRWPPVADSDDTAQVVDDDASAIPASDDDTSTLTASDDTPAPDESQEASDAEVDAEAEVNDGETQMADTVDEDPKAPSL